VEEEPAFARFLPRDPTTGGASDVLVGGGGSSLTGWDSSELELELRNVNANWLKALKSVEAEADRALLRAPQG
jgi:hypothetical protein